MELETRLDVWALEPYFGGSHKYFLKGLARHSTHRYELFTLPGRHWKWRMHGGALSLATQVSDKLQKGSRFDSAAQCPDVLFASDMLDLPIFRAAVDPRTARIPAIAYFHENQLTYPLPPGVERDLGYGFKNFATAVAADRVLFNSEYHRRQFLGALSALLSTMPDEIPYRHLEDVEAKSGTLPVGCDLRRFDRHRQMAKSQAADERWGDPEAGPLILWNQRWEYDKAPSVFFAALYGLKARGQRFRLAMAGPNQGTPTAEFVRAKAELKDEIVQWGRVAQADDYARLLWASDIVVSTAVHEFFGIAVVEATYCGCRPVLPRRLSYPEIIPPGVHDDVLYEEGEILEALAAALKNPHPWSEDFQRTWVARFDWASLRARYDEEVRRCWIARGPRLDVEASLKRILRPERIRAAWRESWGGILTLIRRAFWLVSATLAYNVVEAVVAVWAGTETGSIALLGFGLDSVIETAAAAVLLWRLRIGMRRGDGKRVERAERRAHSFIGLTFFFLAAYVVAQASLDLVSGRHPDSSLAGIVLAAVSLVIMPLLAAAKLRTASGLGSRALRAEARETLACAYLSFTLLLGLSLNAAFGWWWADAAAALFMVPWLVREGLEGVRGDD